MIGAECANTLECFQLKVFHYGNVYSQSLTMYGLFQEGE
jgi:hypothetical protein